MAAGKRKQPQTKPEESPAAAAGAASASSRKKTRSSSTAEPAEPVSPEKKEKQQVQRGKKAKQMAEEETEEVECAEDPEVVTIDEDMEDEDNGEGNASTHEVSMLPVQRKPKRRAATKVNEGVLCRFLGEKVREQEACRRWPYRFKVKAKGKEKDKAVFKSEDESEELAEAKFHYSKAIVDGHEYNLGDDAYVQAEEGQDNYICKIVEMFESVDGTPYFRAQWFYRARDTVITERLQNLIDEKRVFFSEIQDDNFLDCLVKPLKIARLLPNGDLNHKEYDYYYNMMYLLPNCTFISLRPDDTVVASEVARSESGSTISTEVGVEVSGEVKLLDLYSGCGAMSTGLCLGANSAGVKLVTKWAVDIEKHACKSLKWNHPETLVKNESADNYLHLLQEWEKLCASFSLIGGNVPQHPLVNLEVDEASLDEEDDGGDEEDDGEEDDDSDDNDKEDFEVEKVLDICYGDPKEMNTAALYFKIRWKGYDPEHDTWEPLEGLGNCEEKLKDFVTNGYKRKILPLPGMVDVICGGPPCQAISGFNRFRNPEEPLKDVKNKQLLVFMDIVGFLKPRFVLMENVVDLFKFSGGYLGRYAIGRLVNMNYQARVGMMVAGAYGLAQFRARAFLWGALPTEKLPQYPLPTHDVVVRGNLPREFEQCFVAFEEGSKVNLHEKLLLGDVILDLPPVENDEPRDEMSYKDNPHNEFQRFIRFSRNEMPGCLNFGSNTSHLLYDHRPLQLNDDDYGRVCQIPKKKGANFRELRGVKVGPDNKVYFDPDIERVMLPSGKPLVPDYAMSFIRGSSPKPFGRLWWDETVPTVVTRAEPHNQIILHPTQDRVLTIRENARLQGFPDYYKLFGPIKARYTQVGNAVAVPVARALGYSLSLALKGQSGKEPVFSLPSRFPHVVESNAEVSS